MGFRIEHYAGKVRYTADGMLGKARDPLSPDLSSLMQSSSAPLAATLFPKPKAGFGRGPQQRTTLGAQFKSQLGKLMETLRKTSPHFIRTIKPNPNKRPREFAAPMVLEQLRYSGVFEAVTIRKSGYPFRLTYDRFVGWYK